MWRNPLQVLSLTDSGSVEYLHQNKASAVELHCIFTELSHSPHSSRGYPRSAALASGASSYIRDVHVSVLVQRFPLTGTEFIVSFGKGIICLHVKSSIRRLIPLTCLCIKYKPGAGGRLS